MSGGSRRERFCHFLHSPRFSLLMLAVFLLLGLALDFVPFLHESISLPLERKGITFMSGLLRDRLSGDDPHVVIVKADSIPRITPKERKTTAIDRSETLALMTRIAERNASAIGLDVDVSPVPQPEPGEFADPENPPGYIVHQEAINGKRLMDDSEFLSRVKLLSEKYGIPIALGVHRSSRGEPSQWLGNELYRGLAANVWVNAEHPEDAAGTQSARAVKLPSMATVLLGGRRNDIRPHRVLFEPDFVSASPEAPEEGVEVRVAHPSFLGKVLGSKDTLVGPKELPNSFNKRIVLIGYTDLKSFEHESDTFSVPGFEPVRGVYLHAMAIESYLYGGFDKVGKWGSALLDTILGAFLIFAMTQFKRRQWLPIGVVTIFTAVSVSWLFTSVALGIAFVLLGIAALGGVLLGRQRILEWGLWFVIIATVALLGTYLTLATRIMWPGFAIVILAKFVEPLVHAALHRAVCHEDSAELPVEKSDDDIDIDPDPQLADPVH